MYSIWAIFFETQATERKKYYEEKTTQRVYVRARWNYFTKIYQKYKKSMRIVLYMSDLLKSKQLNEKIS